MAEILYLVELDLFRLGNRNSPRLDNIRIGQDVNVLPPLNGVALVEANNRGISLYTKDELMSRKVSGHVWKLPAGIRLPQDLKLHNDHGGHFMIVPTRRMPLDLFKGLLMDVASQCQYVSKV